MNNLDLKIKIMEALVEFIKEDRGKEAVINFIKRLDIILEI
jgi:hypothetical protein